MTNHAERQGEWVGDSETAEDVVMDAFAALHRRWTAIRDPHEAYRYVRSCVLNGASSRLRRRRIARLHEGSSWSSAPDGSRITYQNAGSAWVVDVATGESSCLKNGSYSTAWVDDDTMLLSRLRGATTALLTRPHGRRVRIMVS